MKKKSVTSPHLFIKSARRGAAAFLDKSSFRTLLGSEERGAVGLALIVTGDGPAIGVLRHALLQVTLIYSRITGNTELGWPPV